MTIETELVPLVKFYSPFDLEKEIYTAKLDKTKLSRLDADFNKWINQQLLADGPGKQQLAKNYRQLLKCFHPDKTPQYTPEIKWLEDALSEGLNNGVCFKTVQYCYQKLTEPAKFKEIEFSGINSIDDCKQWLEKLKKGSSTYSSRSLCSSLIDLLDQSSGFFDETGKIKPKGLKTVVGFIPVVLASLGSALVIEELFAIYVLYFLVLKGGQRLSRSDSLELKQIGQTMQEYTTVTAMATTTLLVRILELIFWASRQCVHSSLQITSSIFLSIMASTTPDSKADLERGVCRDLVLAGESSRPGMQFDMPELKIIAAPFEKYLAINSQQFFGDWRIGRAKRTMVDDFLFRLRVLDQLTGSVETKLAEVQKELDKLKKDKDVYTKKTAEAVDYVQNVIDILLSPAGTEVVVCEKPVVADASI